MIIATVILVFLLIWWAVSLLEIALHKKDHSFTVAAVLVLLAIPAVCFVYALMQEIMNHLLKVRT